jgi:hypothetical protein
MINDMAALNRDDGKMVGFSQIKELKHGYPPLLDCIPTIKNLPGFLERFELNFENHQAVWVIEQIDYPLPMKG